MPNYFRQGRVCGDMIAIAVTMVVAMTFAFSARHVERSAATAAPMSRLTLRRALLMYRFQRPIAKFGCDVFCLWLPFAVLNPVAPVLDAFQDPRLISADLVGLVAIVGWSLGIRYWAVMLEERAR